MVQHLRLGTVALGLTVGLSLAACSDATEPQIPLGLELEPAGLTLIRGATDTVRVTVTGGSGLDITLSATPSTDDVSVGFDSESTAASRTLTLTVATEAAPGARTVTVTGSRGGEEASADLSLTIEEELSGDPAELYAPGVVGEVRTVEVEGEEFTYEVIDGLAIFQGDMILGDAATVEEQLEALAGGAGENHPLTSTCRVELFGFACARWTDGIIGYAFADNWGSDSNNTMMRNRIRDAMTHWEDSTSIRFVERTGGERLVFRNADGCSSDVGRRVTTGIEPQWLNVSTTCGFGVIVHELGHAVGLWHEHSRMDRDLFVRVDFGAVQDFRLHQFFTHGGFGADVGHYDYGSIMHYRCDDFARDSRNTIEPLMAGVTCADIGQRDGLSEGDILGAYSLYPPAYSITGATSGAAGDRFDLSVSFDTEPVRDDYIVWRSDRVPHELGTGPSISILAGELPAGDHVITASVVIFNMIVVRESIALTLDNSPPSVELDADPTADLNRLFFVDANVSDAEDGSCPYFDCEYRWSPTPERDNGPVAGYRFYSVGSRTIELVVADHGGATDSDAVTVDVVNSPPRPIMDVPTDGSSFSEGSRITLAGSATDINHGPGPGPGTLECSRLRWGSSDPTDLIGSARTGCSPPVVFGSVGTRTVTLVAIDAQGDAGFVQADVTVTACEGNCQPNVSFVIDTPRDFDDSSYSDSFDDPGYYRTTPIQMTATLSDADEPPDNPLHVEWTVERDCTGASCPPEFVIGQGDVNVPGTSDPASTVITWEPEDDVDTWHLCTQDPRRYIVTLEVADDRGASNRFTTEIMLACIFI